MQCVEQCLERGHVVDVLIRTPAKLPAALRERVTVIEGDGLDGDAVRRTLAEGAEAVLFAIGIDKHSPENLCADVTAHILAAMPDSQAKRFVFCGGGSTLVPQDTVTFGARFVSFFASTFMGLRHRDKLHQFALLESHRELEWCGVRPLQLRNGPLTREYRAGYHAFSGMSWLSFADCAHAMIEQLSEDRWLHEAPIVCY